MLASILLSSCSQPLKNEEEAVLRVAVHSDAYKNSLIELYEKTYPDVELEVDVVREEVIEEKIFNQEEMEYDVYWVEDAFIPLILDDILELNDKTEVPIQKDFSEIFDQVKVAYQPIMARSDLYYALDLDKIEQDEISEEIFLSIEKIGEIDKGFYYLDQPLFTFSFLTSNINYFPGKEKSTINFNGNSFKEALSDYQRVLELIECDDQASYDNWFIQNSYYSGFVTLDMQLNEDETINGGKYKITKLPTINEKQLYTQAVSYGYVVNAKSAYPNAAKNLVTLMHSIAGIQALCNTGLLVPMIPLEMLDEFIFENVHDKERIIAHHYAIPRSFIGIESRNEAAINYLLLEETNEKLKACDLDNIKECQSDLEENYQEWLE